MNIDIHRENGVDDDDENDRYRAPALDKGLDILELLAGIDGGLTQAEIAKHMGRNANEFYRMLDRLVKRGYVTKIYGDRYSLTLKLFGLAQLHAPVRRLASYATPLMRELAEQSRQANQLVVFDRGSAVVIAQQEAPGYWGISIRVGSHISLYNTGSGHVLLAFRTPEERAMMIQEYEDEGEDVSELTPEFLSRLDQIRDRGYETMPSLQTAGVVNISAPIIGPDGKAIAALTIPYITIINMPNAPDISQTTQLLVKASQQVSKSIG
ncbi:MAG: IclR family transcriptional regulator [Rhizobium sp.]|nr:IclR family transcriptional regulator [Rhizobium sp.]